MRAHIREINFSSGAVWWEVYTDPICFSVWWESDGTKTMDQFLDEQAAKMREFVSVYGKAQAFPAHTRRQVSVLRGPAL